MAVIPEPAGQTGVVPEPSWRDIFFIPQIAGWSWIGYVISAVYFVGFWTWRGQTLGKIVMKLKVVKYIGFFLSDGGIIPARGVYDLRHKEDIDFSSMQEATGLVQRHG